MTPRSSRPGAIVLSWTRLPQAVALASCALIALSNVYVVTVIWPFDDIQAYLGAAERLLAGEPLYSSQVPVSELYRYSPWFAAAWIPATYAPRLVVEALWLGILAASFVAVLFPYRRGLTRICLALLLGALLYRTLGWGNVQPLMVAVLVWVLPTRAGPWAMGVIGSLKPLVLAGVAVYLWRHEWRSAAIALLVAVVLWAPILLFELSDYPALRSVNLFDSTLLLVVGPFLSGQGRAHRARTASSTHA